MKWFKAVVGFFKQFISEEDMSIPRKADGALDEKAISKIYIVYSSDGSPIFIVAITVHGAQTESATPELVNEIKNNPYIPFAESSLEDYVYYYHTQEQLNEIKRRLKMKR